MKKALIILSTLTLLIISIQSCKKDPDPTVPKVTTVAVSNKTMTSASGGGTVTSDGGVEVTTRGICWSTNNNPTIADYKTSDGSGTGDFTSGLTNLKPGITYYVKAYATNKIGTGYGEAVSFTTPNEVLDFDGNTYHAVGIGTQIWLAENLRTSKYNDGTDIPLIPDNSEWANTETPAFCYYSNDPTYAEAYGALYNWFAVASEKLCPTGWHVASKSDWTSMIEYLGGVTLAGARLKEAGTAHWNDPNGTSTNESGFKAVPAGYRKWDDGTYVGLGNNCSIWSSTPNDDFNSWSYVLINYTTDDVLEISNNVRYAIGVRCIKN